MAAIWWIRIIIAATTSMIKFQKRKNCASKQLMETEHGTY